MEVGYCISSLTSPGSDKLYDLRRFTYLIIGVGHFVKLTGYPGFLPHLVKYLLK